MTCNEKNLICPLLLAKPANAADAGTVKITPVVQWQYKRDSPERTRLPPTQPSPEPRAADTPAQPLPAPLRQLCLWSSLLALASWIVAILVWRVRGNEDGGMWMHWDDRFTDLTHYDAVFPYLHRLRFFTGAERFAYPAPSAVVYDGLLHLGHLRLAAFLTLTLLLAIVPAALFAKALIERGLRSGPATLFLSCLLLTSWPLLFLLERGNIEALLILFTLLGSVFFWHRRPVPAAALWGLAAALKIYPLVLLVLFLHRRQIGALAVGLGTTALTLLLSFWFVGPTIAIAARGTLHGISGFVGSYATHSRHDELMHDHSYLAFFKAPLAVQHLHLSSDVSRLSHVYFVVAGLAVVLLFPRFRRLPVLNQYILVVIAMVSLPPVSYDYTLLHLYPAFALLVLLLFSLDRRNPAQTSSLKPLFWCFTLLFASENCLFYLGLHLNGMIKAAALFWASVLLLRHPLPGLQPADAEPPLR